ncbi:hypothetical protein ACFZBP_12470 [Streptomyces sp. NPDC008086]|uniref:hypothetical protein n=1 Tax=Streptomyces sp. NPDC008086 TaxID=3364807 RepID=UPI0036E2BF18
MDPGRVRIQIADSDPGMAAPAASSTGTRPVFATRARFPEADGIVADRPHRCPRHIAPSL